MCSLENDPVLNKLGVRTTTNPIQLALWAGSGPVVVFATYASLVDREDPEDPTGRRKVRGPLGAALVDGCGAPSSLRQSSGGNHGLLKETVCDGHQPLRHGVHVPFARLRGGDRWSVQGDAGHGLASGGTVRVQAGPTANNRCGISPGGLSLCHWQRECGG
ncbi:hypothetical protein GCM10010393_41560 [Streptomyces gobitricini]|uniref:Uncharacterized protein n=1 Tax=Streptomyces gobitricini TaxID=68211 RepID=A0ABN3MMT2_9ACTN